MGYYNGFSNKRVKYSALRSSEVQKEYIHIVT